MTDPLKSIDLRINQSLSCEGCGYDVRGLELTSDCPECGTKIWDTVRQSVDPVRDQLPLIHNPASVGGGLVWLSICMLIASVVVLIVNWFFVVDDQVSKIAFIQWWQILPLSGLIAIFTLPGIWMLWPARRSLANTNVLRFISLLMVGVVGWGVLGTYQWFQIAQLVKFRGLPLESIPGLYTWLWVSTKLAMLLCALIFLWGLNGILTEVGRRSRKYRSARGGKQRLREIGIAIIIAGAGMVIAIVGNDQAARLIGVVVAIIANLVILIGLAFLVVNTWWIFQDLKPRASLQQLLESQEDPAMATEASKSAAQDQGNPNA